MQKHPKFYRTEATVVEQIDRANYLVETAGGTRLHMKLSGKQRMNYPHIVIGQQLTIEINIDRPGEARMTHSNRF